MAATERYIPTRVDVTNLRHDWQDEYPRVDVQFHVTADEAANIARAAADGTLYLLAVLGAEADDVAGDVSP